jgi:hypothetical protein
MVVNLDETLGVHFGLTCERVCSRVVVVDVRPASCQARRATLVPLRGHGNVSLKYGDSWFLTSKQVSSLSLRLLFW